MRCLICHESSEVKDGHSHLVTCPDCNRSWHHRCHQPPIPDNEIRKILDSYLITPTLFLSWTCRKCSRKKAANGSAQRLQGPSEILLLDTLGPAVPMPAAPEPPKRPVVSEIIDLTSPESSKFRRPQRSTPSPAEIIDLSEATSTPTPSDLADVIDLASGSSSPVVATLQSLEPLASHFPAPAYPINIHDFPDGPVDPRPMDVDGFRASLAPSVTASPALSLSAAPMRPQTPSIIVDFPSMKAEDIDRKPLLVDLPSMEVDDMDQQPISSLFQNLAVSVPRSRPRGGSLGPTWLRERYETSDQMALWERAVEKQNRIKPLSKRKPERTRFMGPPRELYIVLPIVQTSRPEVLSLT